MSTEEKVNGPDADQQASTVDTTAAAVVDRPPQALGLVQPDPWQPSGAPKKQEKLRADPDPQLEMEQELVDLILQKVPKMKGKHWMNHVDGVKLDRENTDKIVGKQYRISDGDYPEIALYVLDHNGSKWVVSRYAERYSGCTVREYGDAVSRIQLEETRVVPNPTEGLKLRSAVRSSPSKAPHGEEHCPAENNTLPQENTGEREQEHFNPESWETVIVPGRRRHGTGSGSLTSPIDVSSQSPSDDAARGSGTVESPLAILDASPAVKRVVDGRTKAEIATPTNVDDTTLPPSTSKAQGEDGRGGPPYNPLRPPAESERLPLDSEKFMMSRRPGLSGDEDSDSAAEGQRRVADPRHERHPSPLKSPGSGAGGQDRGADPRRERHPLLLKSPGSGAEGQDRGADPRHERHPLLLKFPGSGAEGQDRGADPGRERHPSPLKFAGSGAGGQDVLGLNPRNEEPVREWADEYGTKGRAFATKLPPYIDSDTEEDYDKPWNPSESVGAKSAGDEDAKLSGGDQESDGTRVIGNHFDQLQQEFVEDLIVGVKGFRNDLSLFEGTQAAKFDTSTGSSSPPGGSNEPALFYEVLFRGKALDLHREYWELSGILGGEITPGTVIEVACKNRVSNFVYAGAWVFPAAGSFVKNGPPDNKAPTWFFNRIWLAVAPLDNHGNVRYKSKLQGVPISSIKGLGTIESVAEKESFKKLLADHAKSFQDSQVKAERRKRAATLLKGLPAVDPFVSDLLLDFFRLPQSLEPNKLHRIYNACMPVLFAKAGMDKEVKSLVMQQGGKGGGMTHELVSMAVVEDFCNFGRSRGFTCVTDVARADIRCLEFGCGVGTPGLFKASMGITVVMVEKDLKIYNTMCTAVGALAKTFHEQHEQRSFFDSTHCRFFTSWKVVTPVTFHQDPTKTYLAFPYNRCDWISAHTGGDWASQLAALHPLAFCSDPPAKGVYCSLELQGASLRDRLKNAGVIPEGNYSDSSAQLSKSTQKKPLVSWMATASEREAYVKLLKIASAQGPPPTPQNLPLSMLDSRSEGEEGTGKKKEPVKQLRKQKRKAEQKASDDSGSDDPAVPDRKRGRPTKNPQAATKKRSRPVGAAGSSGDESEGSVSCATDDEDRYLNSDMVSQAIEMLNNQDNSIRDSGVRKKFFSDLGAARKKHNSTELMYFSRPTMLKLAGLSYRSLKQWKFPKKDICKQQRHIIRFFKRNKKFAEARPGDSVTSSGTSLVHHQGGVSTEGEGGARTSTESAASGVLASQQRNLGLTRTPDPRTQPQEQPSDFDSILHDQEDDGLANWGQTSPSSGLGGRSMSPPHPSALTSRRSSPTPGATESDFRDLLSSGLVTTDVARNLAPTLFKHIPNAAEIIEKQRQGEIARFKSTHRDSPDAVEDLLLRGVLSEDLRVAATEILKSCGRTFPPASRVIKAPVPPPFFQSPAASSADLATPLEAYGGVKTAGGDRGGKILEGSTSEWPSTLTSLGSDAGREQPVPRSVTVALPPRPVLSPKGDDATKSQESTVQDSRTRLEQMVQQPESPPDYLADYNDALGKKPISPTREAVNKLQPSIEADLKDLSLSELLSFAKKAKTKVVQEATQEYAVKRFGGSGDKAGKEVPRDKTHVTGLAPGAGGSASYPLESAVPAGRVVVPEVGEYGYLGSSEAPSAFYTHHSFAMRPQAVRPPQTIYAPVVPSQELAREGGHYVELRHVQGQEYGGRDPYPVRYVRYDDRQERPRSPATRDYYSSDYYYREPSRLSERDRGDRRSPPSVRHYGSRSPPPVRRYDSRSPPPVRHYDSRSPPPVRHYDRRSPPPARYCDSRYRDDRRSY